MPPATNTSVRIKFTESLRGAIANSMPASSAPITLRTPHVTTIASHTMPTTTVKDRGLDEPTVDPQSAPPSPATNALTEKTIIFARTTLMPAVTDAFSLARTETHTHPH